MIKPKHYNFHDIGRKPEMVTTGLSGVTIKPSKRLQPSRASKIYSQIKLTTSELP